MPPRISPRNFWSLILVLLCTHSVSDAVARNYDGVDHTIANLIVQDNHMHRRLAAKMLYNVESPNPALLDLASHQLAMHINSSNEQEIDTTSWIIKALSKAKTTRYHAQMTDIKRKKRGIKQINRYTRLYFGNTRDAAEEKPITFSRSKFLKEREAILTSNPKILFDPKILEQIVVGDSIETIYKKLGKPSGISDTEKPIKIRGAGRVNLQSIRLIYRGAGSITLTSELGKYEVQSKSYWPIESILTRESDLDYWENIHVVIRRGSGADLRTLTQHLSSYESNDTAMLDAAAERIWNARHSVDRWELDGAAWLLRYIGNSHNPRYLDFLTKLKKGKPQAHRKIRRYAGVALLEIPGKYSYTKSFIPK